MKWAGEFRLLARLYLPSRSKTHAHSLKTKHHLIHHNVVIVPQVQRRWGGQTTLGGENHNHSFSGKKKKKNRSFPVLRAGALSGWDCILSLDSILPSCGQKGDGRVTTGSTQTRSSLAWRSSSPWWGQADLEVLLLKWGAAVRCRKRTGGTGAAQCHLVGILLQVRSPEEGGACSQGPEKPI